MNACYVRAYMNIYIYIYVHMHINVCHPTVGGWGRYQRGILEGLLFRVGGLLKGRGMCSMRSLGFRGLGLAA